MMEKFILREWRTMPQSTPDDEMVSPRGDALLLRIPSLVDLPDDDSPAKVCPPPKTWDHLEVGEFKESAPEAKVAHLEGLLQWSCVMSGQRAREGAVTACRGTRGDGLW